MAFVGDYLSIIIIWKWSTLHSNWMENLLLCQELSSPPLFSGWRTYTCTGEEVKHYQIPRVLLTINQQRQLNKSMMLHRGNFFGFWCWWSLHWDLNLISQEMLSRAVKFTLPSDGWNWPELRCMQISSELNCTGQCANEEPIDSYHGQCWLLMPGSANLLDLCWSLSTASSVRLPQWLRRSF